VGHAYNSSYSGGRNQEDSGSKPAQANGLQDPVLKNPLQKSGCWSGEGEDPVSSPSTTKKSNRSFK
jgi:hypothetical protein